MEALRFPKAIMLKALLKMEASDSLKHSRQKLIWRRGETGSTESFELEGTLKMKAVCSSETLVYFYQPRRGHIPDDSNLHWLRRVPHNMPSCLKLSVRGCVPPVARICCSSHGRKHVVERLAVSAPKGRFLCPPPAWGCFADGLKTF
jgi:hypothetical protein